MDPTKADLQEAQRLYTLSKATTLCLSDRQFLVDLRRKLYSSKLRTQMEQTMPPMSFDSVWYHPQLNPSGAPPRDEKQVYLWEVQPLTEPLDIAMPNVPKEASKEPSETTPTHYEGAAQLKYNIKPRNL